MMKYIYSILLAFFFVSCSEEITNSSETTTSNESDGVLCEASPFVYEGNGISRSSLSYGSAGMDFAWDEKEKITIFSDTENSGNYTLQSQSGNIALFTGGGFDLTEGKLYYAFSKSVQSYGDDEKHNAPASFKADAYTNVICTYDGQRQIEDFDPSHLGMYDYQAAAAKATANNRARFSFKHLGLTLAIAITDLPSDVKFNKLIMYDASEDLFRGFDRTINLAKGMSDTDYSPAWNSFTPDDDDQRFTVDLGATDGTGLAADANNRLVIFAEIPPFDFTGKTIAFRLEPVAGQTKDGKAVKPYFCLYNGKSLVAGKAYQMVMNAQECTQYTINLKIMHEWHNGNTVNQSRAAGDPGTTTEDVLPTHLYAFFVNNGALVQTAKMENIPATNWETVDHISTLKDGVGWKIAKEGTDESESTKLTLDNQYTNNPKVYIVATTAAMDFRSVAYGTSESTIQALAYNYASQEQMRGLYSTPYCEGSAFVGALGDDVKDVRLYHVASKVDLNWESEAALTGNVSVNQFQTTGLKIFTPTKCGGDTPATESVTITPGTAHNGRAVFYIPQPANATYNVTLGGTTQDITFTPDAVYTSWFRGLITKQ